MPKKQPKNSFYFFMLDYKARCERNGERFPNGLRDVQDPAGEEWKVLPAHMKAPYEDKAKIAKQQAKGDISGKVTSLHTNYKYLDRKKEEEERQKLVRDSWIDKKVSSLSSLDALADQKLYLIHANYLVMTSDEQYLTVEVAVLEFCIGKGVTNTFHTLIDPGPLPLGSFHEAQIKSQEYHQIPADRPIGEEDKNKIFKGIKKVLEPARMAEGEWPPLFTMEENVAANHNLKCCLNLLEVLSINAGEDPEQFRIYPLDRLFYELKNAAAQLADADTEVFPSRGFAKNELERDIHNYDFNIACEFHKEIDVVQYCSLSFVQRWVYLICDHCCRYVEVEMIPGKHCPINTDIKFLPRQAKKAQEQQKPTQPSTFTWVDNSKKVSQWNPVQEPPLPRPTRQSRPMGLMQNLPVSEEEFPAINIGRGRGRSTPSSGRGFPAGPNYAAAMKR